MKHNLVITFDLFKGVGGVGLRPITVLSGGQNYAAMEKAIKALGVAIKVNYTVWVVSSGFDAVHARDRLVRAADANDKIVVFDATKDAYAATANIDASVLKALKQSWEGQGTSSLGLAASMSDSLASKALLGALARYK